MNRISRRLVVQSAAAAAATVSVGTPSIQGQTSRQTLRFVAESDLTILDPIWTTAYATRNHGYLVYDTLFGTDENFQVRPQMVERTAVSPDGMKYTFTLRDKFWKKIDKSTWTKAPAAYRAALAAAMPARRGAFKTARRSAGVGSLGRPRWIGVAEWHGAPVVREAKAVLPSSWLRARGERGTRIRCGEIANGRYRAPDPWYHLSKTVVVRRLSPNNRKIEVDDDPAVLLSGEMFELMGFDLACAHLGGANRAGAIKRDLERRKGAWLQELADRMAASVEADSAAWTGEHKSS
jgi:Uncharacterized protein conserved in bacteria (DUF2252)